MINKIWKGIGSSLGWILWPLLCLYLQGSKRTRVLILYRDEVLLVKGWLGNNRWALPGGGLQRNENPTEGALREMYEETGIEANATELQEIFQNLSIKLRFYSYSIYAFKIELNHRPTLRRQKNEISALNWLKISEIDKSKKFSPEVHLLLSTINSK